MKQEQRITPSTIGSQGEEFALKYLHSQGLQLREKNYRCQLGEIDLIMFDKKNQILVFVEVKQRRTSSFGSPTEMVGRNKQKKLIRAAHHYLAQQPRNDFATRFDVVGIESNSTNTPMENGINWIQGAFYAYE